MARSVPKRASGKRPRALSAVARMRNVETKKPQVPSTIVARKGSASA